MQNGQVITDTANLRQTIRKEMRQRRNSLSQNKQSRAAQMLCEQVKTLVSANDTVALYLDNDGEVSTTATINYFHQQQINTLLPVMHSFHKGYLNFQRYDHLTKMVRNSFNILEPELNASQTFALAQIDFIFMPLVAFDEQGNRLGMGGGFYDRTLSHIHLLKNKPQLIGLAHDCQMATDLPKQSWDIPLDLIVTPSKIITAKY